MQVNLCAKQVPHVPAGTFSRFEIAAAASNWRSVAAGTYFF
jgi:hypothetical protein